VRSILLVFLLLSLDVNARVFTGIDGRTLEGTILSLRNDKVQIQRAADGLKFALPLERFSVKDQNFLKAEAAAGRLTADGYTGTVKTVTPVKKNPLHLNASRRIDLILEQYWASRGIEPAPLVSDEQFVRRTYLSLIGRIPTAAEAIHFFNSSQPNKRSLLVDKLLDSPGYVSHFFTLWADVLRARTQSPHGGQSGGVYYVPWIKEQLRTNVPYDAFVRSLLTADGYPWDNPAASYHLRDIGMPLDSLAMTTQIFLGTRLECAQCHNHPTDQWTQKDFYELAAFSHGLNTYIKGYSEGEIAKGLYEGFDKKRASVMQDLKEDYLKAGGKRSTADKNLFLATRFVMNPLRYGVSHTDRDIALPHDYAYPDAKPKSLVRPAVLYGQLERTVPSSSPKRVDRFAEWLISKKNTQFTSVVTNRLLRYIMGQSLINPIDQMTANTVSAIPELSQLLNQTMQYVDFDMKQFIRVLCNTRFFQRQAVVDEPDVPDDYQWQGPVLRRMSAEQIWDSIATLLIPDVDALYTDVYTARYFATRYKSDQPPAVVRLAEAYSKNELVDHMHQFAATFGPYRTMPTRLRKAKAERLNDPQTYAQLKRQYEEISAEYHRLIDPAELVSEQSGLIAKPRSAGMMMGSMSDADSGRTNRALRNIRRASELASPVGSGHLLQIFGQSDRQLIENSSRESNLLQALFMMNSHETNALMAFSSMPVFEADLALSAEEKLATIFIGFLSRRPTAQEQDLLIDDFRIDPINARKRIIWSMLNSQQFVFLQ
jgi:hypothetical protein